MRAVNLLPQTQRRTPGIKGARNPLAVAGAVVVLGSMGYWGYSVHGEVARQQVGRRDVGSQRDELRAQLGAFQAAQARDAAQAVRRGAVVGLVAGRVNWERIVRDLSAVMPRQVWLTNLKGEAVDRRTLTIAAGSAYAGPRQHGGSAGRPTWTTAYPRRPRWRCCFRAPAVPDLGEPLPRAGCRTQGPRAPTSVSSSTSPSTSARRTGRHSPRPPQPPE